MKKRMLSVIICLIVLAGLTTVVIAAEPTGADSVTKVTTSRRTDFNQPIESVSAEAGNVTELEINITQQTNHWQGYYGNISGSITLDNANNWSMYQWTGISDVGGNIFATDALSVTWTDVFCANLSSDQPATNCRGFGEACLNISEMHAKYGMTDTDADNINKTFTSTNNIDIDTVSLSNCPATNIYVNDSAQSTYWNETLLTVNDTEDLIYAVNVEDDILGFNNKTWDFQMIVGEDEGTGATYYFYVELA